MKTSLLLVFLFIADILRAGCGDYTNYYLHFTYSRKGFPIQLSGSAKHYYNSYSNSYPLVFDTVPNLDILGGGKAIATSYGKFSTVNPRLMMYVENAESPKENVVIIANNYWARYYMKEQEMFFRKKCLELKYKNGQLTVSKHKSYLFKESTLINNSYPYLEKVDSLYPETVTVFKNGQALASAESSIDVDYNGNNYYYATYTNNFGITLQTDTIFAIDVIDYKQIHCLDSLIWSYDLCSEYRRKQLKELMFHTIFNVENPISKQSSKYIYSCAEIPFELSIKNLQGVTIYRRKYQIESGMQAYAWLNESNIHEGLYYVEVVLDNRISWMKKLVIIE